MGHLIASIWTEALKEYFKKRLTKNLKSQQETEQICYTQIKTHTQTARHAKFMGTLNTTKFNF